MLQRCLFQRRRAAQLVRITLIGFRRPDVLSACRSAKIRKNAAGMKREGIGTLQSAPLRKAGRRVPSMVHHRHESTVFCSATSCRLAQLSSPRRVSVAFIGTVELGTAAPISHAAKSARSRVCCLVCPSSISPSHALPPRSKDDNELHAAARLRVRYVLPVSQSWNLVAGCCWRVDCLVHRKSVCLLSRGEKVHCGENERFSRGKRCGD